MTIDGSLRSTFRRHLPDFDWVSVETGLTERGVPDSNYCCDGVEGWIEHKTCRGWRVSIRPEQVAWCERRLRHGGHVFLAVRKPDYGMWLFAGENMRRLLDNRVCDLSPLGVWVGSPSRWDWEQIRKLLLT